MRSNRFLKKIVILKKLNLFLTLTLVLLFSFIQFGYNSVSNLPNYEYTHTHYHDEHNDYMNSQFQDHSTTEQSHDDQPHKHTVVISNEVPLILNRSFGFVVGLLDVISYQMLNQDLPNPPFTDGIFRPPISS